MKVKVKVKVVGLWEGEISQRVFCSGWKIVWSGQISSRNKHKNRIPNHKYIILLLFINFFFHLPFVNQHYFLRVSSRLAKSEKAQRYKLQATSYKLLSHQPPF